MTRQVRIVDVFTERPLAGNQLAVVLDGRDLAILESDARVSRTATNRNVTPVLATCDGTLSDFAR